MTRHELLQHRHDNLCELATRILADADAPRGSQRAETVVSPILIEALRLELRHRSARANGSVAT